MSHVTKNCIYVQAKHPWTHDRLILMFSTCRMSIDPLKSIQAE